MEDIILIIILCLLGIACTGFIGGVVAFLLCSIYILGKDE